MKCIFDASAMYSLLAPASVEKLVEGYTIELVRFEIGNILWKERELHKKMNENDQAIVMDLANHALKSMSILSADGHEGNILKLASELHISFYDASYVYFSKELNLPLITKDYKLSKKVAGRIDVKEPENI